MNMSVFKNRTAALAAGIALAALTGPALAADAISEAPPAPPAAPVYEEAPAGWDGAYVGVTGSYSAGEASHSQPVPNSHVTEGFKGGGFGGFNMQNGQFVYGVEADVSGGEVDGNNAGRGFESSVDGSLRARAGLAVGERTLVYGTAGLAAARLKAAEGGVIDSKTGLGWTAGAGVDVKVTDDVFARGEYRYTDYGSQTFQTGSGANTVKADENRFTVGLGVKF